ncbi:MAG: putative efflux pump rane fusion protein [Candidatus Angelobacter sp.]|nr:putative efflux pump rane fusion protein [Candidatus Angelobacter sp.]
MENRLFRQASLERLTSPEQLDQLLSVTNPKRWIALGALFLLLGTSIVWGYHGTILTTASGDGVIIRSGGVLNIVSRGGGVIAKIHVRSGDKIRTNQLVATIAQPVLVEQKKSLDKALAEAMEERERSIVRHKDSSKLQIEAVDRERANAELQISELTEQHRLRTEQLAVQEQLLAKGLVTKTQLLDLRQKLVEIQDKIASLRAQLKQFEARKFSIASEPEDADMERRSHISGLQRDLAGIQKELELAQNVVSPYDGEVVEVKASPGMTVAASQPVFSIQPDEQNLEVVAYLPSLQAKDTKDGMEAQVSASNIKREEYGFIKGQVDYVADFPTTREALMRNFANEALVQTLTKSGAVTEVRITLKRAPNPSGFEWSTSHGPNIVLSGGTICTVQVVTGRQKPIALLFPYIKQKLGVS